MFSSLRYIPDLIAMHLSSSFFVLTGVQTHRCNKRYCFIQDFELGGGRGGEQDGSRMIVVCEMRVCLLGGLGACSPRKILNLHPLRLLLTQSGTKFPNNILMTHTYVQ